METPKIKRYRLGVSRYFPATHARAGQPTEFTEKIGNALIEAKSEWCKIHTIRGNYELWAKRMAEVQAGRAVIELFYWSGKPYHKDKNGVGQVVFAKLDKDSGCGVQEIEFSEFGSNVVFIWSDRIEDPAVEVQQTLARNDGLSHADFKEWFKKYDLSKPMAIIHFTSFRY